MFPIPKVTDEEIKEAELKLKGKANAKKKDMPLAEPDASSPIFEEVPEDLPEQAEIPSVGKAPLGLTKKIKKHLHETKKPLKARRKI